MKLNNFIQNTSDEELLKSLYKDCIDSGKEPADELVKAMNRAGLVQVQRVVNGKHGQYTRMQWVKSSEVKDSDKVVGQKSEQGSKGKDSKDSKATDKPSDKSSAKDTSSEDLADNLDELTGKNMFEIRDMAAKPLKKLLKQMAVKLEDYDVDSMDIDNVTQSGNKLTVTATLRGTYTDRGEEDDFEETVKFTMVAKKK